MLKIILALKLSKNCNNSRTKFALLDSKKLSIEI